MSKRKWTRLVPGASALGTRADRLLPANALMGAALLALSALGAAADGAADIDADTRKSGTVFVSSGSTCSEDYASELRAAGIEVEARRMGRLDAVASFVGLPTNPAPDHLVIMNGYVIADHVGPSAVRDLLGQKPKIRGLAGMAKCPTPESHSALDAVAPRSF